MSAGGNVKATASGNINIKHTGDLYVDQIISTGGDLDIHVLGSIFDKNLYEAIDPNSDYASLGEDLGLIAKNDDGSINQQYQARIDNRIAAFEREFTDLYFEAWTNINEEGYNPDYVFQYSDEQRAILKNSQLTDADILNEEEKRTEFYHNAFKLGFDLEYAYKASDKEIADLTEFTAWTKEQLENQIALPTFLLTQDAGTRQNTTSIIEAPNFAGRDITLFATGTIGNENGTIDIPVGLTFDELKAHPNWEIWRRTIADAEWDDVTFDTPGFITFSRNGKSIELPYYRFQRYDDINIQATGVLKTTSGGATYLGSESDVTVDTIVAGAGGSEQLRLKVDGNLIGIVRGLQDTRPHITAKNAILEAAGGYLGADGKNPLIVHLTGNGDENWIVGRGTDSVYLSFVDVNGVPADVRLREIGSAKGDVHLTTTGSFIADTAGEQLDYDVARVGGHNIVLVALGGSIGEADKKYLAINQAFGGSVSLNATDDIYVYGTKSFNVTELLAGGFVEVTAYWDLGISGKFVVEVGNVLLESMHGDLLLTNAMLDVVTGSATFRAASDVIISGGSIDIGGEWNVTANDNIYMTAVDVSAKSAYLNARNGSIIIGTPVNEWAFYSLPPNMKLNIAGILNMLAANDIRIANADITAGDTTLIAQNGDVSIEGGSISINGTWDIIANDGDIALKSVNVLKAGATTLDAAGNLKFDGGTANLGDTKLLSGNDIDVTDWTLVGTGTLDATATNDISVVGSSLTTSGDMSKTAGNDISIAGSSLSAAGDMSKTAGNDITVMGSSLTATGDMSKTAGNDISVANSSLTAKNMSKTAGNDISVAGSTLNASKNMSKTAGNDISVMNSGITVGDVYGISAANRLTVYNTTATIGDFAGNYGLADFDASGYRLLDWHFYTKTVLLSGIDIYNDPVYWNSLAYDRITGRPVANFWLQNITGNQDDDDFDGLIDGLWLLLKEEEEDEELSKTLSEPGAVGIPVAKRSVIQGW